MLDPNDREVGGRDPEAIADAHASANVPSRAPIDVQLHAAQAMPSAPRRQLWLAGEHAPLPERGLFSIVDGLLRLPANLMYELSNRPGTHQRLLVLMILAMAIAGVFVGAFAGGFQLLAVPLKLSLGMMLCALICLPSLYIFSCLSGGQLGLRETSGALLAGVALTALLLVGFAPVSWVFSQATDSRALMGGIHLFFFFVSVYFGLRLTRRALANLGGRAVPALALWSVVFVFVALQMSTTLRPLVGPFEGLGLADKQFFLTYWLS